MRPRIALAALLVCVCFRPSAGAQTLTYSVAGKLTTVPRCVSTLFSIGDPWAIDVTVDLSPPEEDDPETEAESEVADGEDGDGAPTEDEDTDPAESNVEPEFTMTERHTAHTFAWTIGSVVGNATGITRVFVSNDHLLQDSIAWQALGYSATFDPIALGVTAIRGIQAGLVDTSSSVVDTTDLPEDLALPQFDDGGFFQVFFRTKCGAFRNNPITGSVTWVEVVWTPTLSPVGSGEPDPTVGGL